VQTPLRGLLNNGRVAGHQPTMIIW
ncbi:hypothetical protein A2U01_0110278, partial [Trifolium medium]|nr:hypothetical protein [Trifolium medium]